MLIKKDEICSQWRIVHNVQNRFKIGDNLITSDKNIICNRCNEFFVNIGLESIYLEPVIENEINTLIKALKDTATGFDNMNSMSLKISSETLIKPLTHICNLSLTQGIFPSQLKIAHVIPLYKSDDPMWFNNYRPVSVLCILSKVFEKIMYNRVSAFLEIFKILHENQYGFRKNHLTIWHCFHL